MSSKKESNSIEDILNASDSDEDNPVDTAAVDLEMLLEDDDDEDTVTPAPRSIKALEASNPQLDTRSGSSTANISSSKLTSLFGSTSASLSDPVASLTASVPAMKEDLTEKKLAFDSSAELISSYRTASSEIEQTIFDVDSDDLTTDSDSIAALALADKREHRFLMAGIRDVISALQSKRRPTSESAAESAAALSLAGLAPVNKNNLKCSEMDAISSQLRKNASFKSHGPGVATVISVHPKFIAVGTSRGLVLLFDHEQEIRQVIGRSVGATSRCTAAVTAVDISSSGAMLVCGHDTGEVALWDVAKESLLKRVTDVHTFPISRLRVLHHVGEGFTGPGAGAAMSSPTEIFAISVDVRGAVHRIKINKMLWTSFVSEAECLLDGSAGAVTDMDTLPAFQSPSTKLMEVWQNLVGINAGNQFVAFNSLTRTLVVHLHPAVKIRFRWPAPPSSQDPITGGIRPDYVAAVSWSWVHSSECTFPPDAPAPPSAPAYYPVLARTWGSVAQLLLVYPAAPGREDVFHCVVVAEKIFSDHNFIGVKWLSQGTSIALISLTEVIVVRRNLEKIETCAMLPSLSASLRTVFESRSSFDQPLRAVSSAQNAKLYLLSPEVLYSFHVQSWKELVDHLINSGNWLDALSVALDNFKGGSASDDLKADRALVDKYIKRYVDLAVTQNAGSASAASKGAPKSAQNRNHFHLVSGVCIEYCVSSGSMTVLFRDLFNLFQAARQETVFLEAMEPYILSREINQLPQHILEAFIESSAQSLRTSSLERCVLYLDLDNNDTDVLNTFLLNNGLYSGLLYCLAYSQGDYITAFKTVFNCMLAPKVQSTRRQSSVSTGFPNPDQAHIGYKLLLFCKYIAECKIFPRGDACTTSVNQLMSIISFLLQQEFQSSMSDVSCPVSSEYPILMSLAKIDSSAAVHCTCLLLQAWNTILKDRDASSSTVAQSDASLTIGDGYSSLFSFVCLADLQLHSGDEHLRRLFFSSCLSILVCSSHCLSLPLIAAIVNYCSVEVKTRREAEDLLQGLAVRQSRFSAHSNELRELLTRKSFWKALLSMQNRKQNICSKQDFEKAVRFYMSLRVAAPSSPTGKVDEFVFEYIDQFSAYSHDAAGVPNEAKQVLCKFVAELHAIDDARTVSLVCAHLSAHTADIITATSRAPAVQFNLLKALFQSVKDDPDREFIETFSQGEVLTYIRLLLAFHPDEAYKFVTSTDHYPLDETLALCKEKEVFDASAYLLERAGDAAAALGLLHSDISRRIQAAKFEIDSLLRADAIIAGRRSSMNSSLSSTAAATEANRAVLHQLLQTDKSNTSLRTELAAKLPCYGRMLHVTECAVGICSRHSSKAETTMWFETFDHLLKEKQNTRASKSSTGEVVIVLVGMILNAFMKTMQSLIPPQDIIRRVAVQQGQGSRYSEFKDVMVSMVDTYAHDVFLNELLKRLHVTDLYNLHKKKYQNSRRAERYEGPSAEPTNSSSQSDASSSAASNDGAARPRASSPSRRRRAARGGGSAVLRMRDVLKQEGGTGSNYVVHLHLSPPVQFDVSFFDSEGRQPGHLPVTPQFQASFAY